MPDTPLSEPKIYILKHIDTKYLVTGFNPETGSIEYHWDINHARKYTKYVATLIEKERNYLRKVRT